MLGTLADGTLARMMLRMSTLLVRTLRDDPADAEVTSHKLLVRAGYVRRTAPGVYAWLPLGRMVLDNVTRLVREEMLAIGAQEVTLPALLTTDVYEASGRLAEYGDDVFRLADRRGAAYVLGPTHEEMFTVLVRDLCSSYKDFPLFLFQVQAKYRDEKRPRAGVLRGREFLMKDSYSFDLSDDGLAASYRTHRAAYQRIFARLEVEYVPVAAMSGPMGGSVSEEFMAPAAAGEDTIVRCGSCGYAANVEAVETRRADPVDIPHPAAEVIDTPATETVDALVAAVRATGRQIDASGVLKNVVLAVRRPAEDKPEVLVIGVPGDREVDLKRLEAALYPAEVAMFEDFAAQPGLVRGYIGPQVLAGLGIRYLVDPRVAPGSAWVTGANEPGRHAVDVVCGRDFVPDGLVEAAAIRAGDPCPRCSTGLRVERGIEVAHVFQLGRRYTDLFGVDALGPDGTPQRVTMGSYGIGLTRVVGTIAEQHADDRGLCWPASVAPCQVHIVPTGGGDRIATAVALGGQLSAAGLRVLVDDRPGMSAGVRFTDAELLGMPTIVVVGRRISDGLVEVRDRRTGATAELPTADLVARLAG